MERIKYYEILFTKWKKITNSLIDQHYPDLIKKEKIFVTTQGNLKLKSDKLDTSFKDFDAIDFASSNQNYHFRRFANNHGNDEVPFKTLGKHSNITLRESPSKHNTQ